MERQFENEGKMKSTAFDIKKALLDPLKQMGYSIKQIDGGYKVENETQHICFPIFIEKGEIILFDFWELTEYARLNQGELLEFVNSLNEQALISRFWYDEKDNELLVESVVVKPFVKEIIPALLKKWENDFMYLPLCYEGSDVFVQYASECEGEQQLRADRELIEESYAKIWSIWRARGDMKPRN